MVDIDLMSSVAAIKDLFVMVESVLLQSQVKLSGIYEVVENNEIEFSIKGDYQTTGIEDYDNILNYGIYVGYNYKF
ncbi:MAG: hypothetical protein J6I71_04215 [Campylobacter sp.]|uniref:hypothetical protein n=1 Tax=Campylobacter sp. TaxID=205 RepID=UPI001B3E418B|nr:hypothetical protein [Campylobacter sp.]MBP3675655.1 hypothetical protein [Campylobacter sp.]